MAAQSRALQFQFGRNIGCRCSFVSLHNALAYWLSWIYCFNVVLASNFHLQLYHRKDLLNVKKSGAEPEGGLGRRTPPPDHCCVCFFAFRVLNVSRPQFSVGVSPWNTARPWCRVEELALPTHAIQLSGEVLSTDEAASAELCKAEAAHRTCSLSRLLKAATTTPWVCQELPCLRQE